MSEPLAPRAALSRALLAIAWVPLLLYALTLLAGTRLSPLAFIAILRELPVTRVAFTLGFTTAATGLAWMIAWLLSIALAATPEIISSAVRRCCAILSSIPYLLIVGVASLGFALKGLFGSQTSSAVQVACAATPFIALLIPIMLETMLRAKAALLRAAIGFLADRLPELLAAGMLTEMFFALNGTGRLFAELSAPHDAELIIASTILLCWIVVALRLARRFLAPAVERAQ